MLIVLALGVLTIHETCRDFNQSTVMIDNQAYSVALAQSDVEKTRGLIGCKAVPNKSGMYFVYKEPMSVSFWMKGMTIPIDMIWIARGRVVGVESNVPILNQNDITPPLYGPNNPVDAVLEVGAGKAREYGIKEGSLVTLISK